MFEKRSTRAYAQAQLSGAPGYPDQTVYIDLEGMTDDVVVTFIYRFNGVQVGASDVQTAHPAFGGSGVTLTSSRAADGQYKAASGSKTVSFGDDDQTVYIDLEGMTRNINVVFNFYYGSVSNVLQSTTVSGVAVTFGGADVQVPVPAFNVAGYYRADSTASVPVNYPSNYDGEGTYVVYVNLQVLAITYPPVTPPIPAGPGAQASTIPLSPGLPSTGDAASTYASLLIGLGIAILAIVSEVAIKMKRED